MVLGHRDTCSDNKAAKQQFRLNSLIRLVNVHYCILKDVVRIFHCVLIVVPSLVVKLVGVSHGDATLLVKPHQEFSM
jgi:hypothetical protein